MISKRALVSREPVLWNPDNKSTCTMGFIKRKRKPLKPTMVSYYFWMGLIKSQILEKPPNIYTPKGVLVLRRGYE